MAAAARLTVPGHGTAARNPGRRTLCAACTASGRRGGVRPPDPACLDPFAARTGSLRGRCAHLLAVRAPAHRAISDRATKRLTTVRTYSPKPGDVQRQWHVIDATDVVLGRLASQAATLLRGKHKPMFAPHVDTGDFVIVINADKVALTGNKREQKMAYRHSGYPGGLRATPTPSCWRSTRSGPSRRPSGMLPHNSLGRQMLTKLKVYAGPEHPHPAQQPQPVRDHPGRAVGAPAAARRRPTREAERHRGRDHHRAVETRRDAARPTPTSYTSESSAESLSAGDPARDRHRPRRGHRPPQGGHRARAPRPRHRPVEDQRPHARGVLPEQGAPAARQRAVRDPRAPRAATTSSPASTVAASPARPARCAWPSPAR